MTWTTLFANDPRRDFHLYLELIEGEQAQAEIRREADGKLYLIVFSSPNVRIPFSWLLSLSEQAETLAIDN